MHSKSLRITEIFASLQGESIYMGLPTTFIRLTGCPLRCQYCDTVYAFRGGKMQLLDEILYMVSSFNIMYVCVTGGEPLAQSNCRLLLQMLCNAAYKVSIETSGACDISKIDPRVTIVMDLKTPGSHESQRNLFKNLEYLRPTDQLKFVLCDRGDYEWACHIIQQYKLINQVEILFSPSWEQLKPTLLADWIVADKMPVRFQMQLHKILWGNAPGV